MTKHRILLVCVAASLSIIVRLCDTSAPAIAQGAAGGKKIVLVAGPPSHGPGEHEHNACVLLLKKCLEGVPGVTATTHLNGWPKDSQAFEGADALVFDMDGGSALFQEDRAKIISSMMDRGVGLVGIHLTVEVRKDHGGPQFLDWLGGYYESGYSFNPDWEAKFQRLPDHPITRGVGPFSIFDEWYFNLRFRPAMKGITPILVARPSDEARSGKTAKPAGPRPHILEARGREEIVAWAFERPIGGRAFGFTGGHYHMNWGDENLRKLMLNAVLWVTGAEVPPAGVVSTVTQADLLARLDRGKAPRAGHVMRKMVQLMAAIQTARQEGRDVSALSSLMPRVQSLQQSGQSDQAERLLDEALRKIGLEPAGIPSKGPLPPLDTALATHPQEPANPQALQHKVQRLYATIQRRQQQYGNLSDLQPVMQRLGPLVQQGKLQEAAPLIDAAMAILEAAQKTDVDDEAGFVPIFNGKDLAGWDGDRRLWSVRDGSMTGRTTAESPLKNNSFLIWKGGVVDDFELRFSYRISADNPQNEANSGVQYRSKDLGQWQVSGYQADIDGTHKYTGLLVDERGRHVLAWRGHMTEVGPNGRIQLVGSLGDPDQIRAVFRDGDWNEYRIIARSNRLTHVINGRVTAHVTDEQADKRALSGILALQLHVGPPMTVQFKDIRLKRLAPVPTQSSLGK